jgi:hypothetical protein
MSSPTGTSADQSNAAITAAFMTPGQRLIHFFTTATNSVTGTSGSQVFFSKRIATPYVDITYPAASSTIAPEDHASFYLAGNCSNVGRTVLVQISTVSASPVCNHGSWSTSLDLSALPFGSQNITADHEDASGANATQVTREFMK